METTFYYHSPLEISIMDNIILMLRKMKKDPKLTKCIIEYDGKKYTIQKGEDLTTIMENCCKIKYKLDPNFHLQCFIDDDAKFLFYSSLLKETSEFNKFIISLSLKLEEIFLSNNNLTNDEYLKIESNIRTKFIRLLSIYELIKARVILHECMQYSNAINTSNHQPK